MLLLGLVLMSGKQTKADSISQLHMTLVNVQAYVHWL
jgi:hypothetical protein